jgi:hypothetical protein
MLALYCERFNPLQSTKLEMAHHYFCNCHPQLKPLSSIHKLRQGNIGFSKRNVSSGVAIVTRLFASAVRGDEMAVW